MNTVEETKNILTKIIYQLARVLRGGPDTNHYVKCTVTATLRGLGMELTNYHRGHHLCSCEIPVRIRKEGWRCDCTVSQMRFQRGDEVSSPRLERATTRWQSHVPNFSFSDCNLGTYKERWDFSVSQLRL